jgi:hypothetical protein
LKPGVDPEHAERELRPLVQRAMTEYIQSVNYRAFLTDGKYAPLVHSMREDIIGDIRQPLWILLGTVGMVLLIACANVTNLFLVRAEGRQREIAVRVALGASRSSLVRKILTEAVVLSALGSGLGLLVSGAGLPALLRAAPATIPRLDQVRLDTTVVLFACPPSGTHGPPPWARCDTAGAAAPTSRRGVAGATCSWSPRRRWRSFCSSGLDCSRAASRT